MNRRHLLVVSGLVGLGLAACKDDEKASPATKEKGAAAEGTGCSTPLDDKSKKMRKTLQYVEKSPKDDKLCSNCVQFIAEKYGDCGGCKLFSGPVQPKGYCASWAAKAEGAPSASAG